MKWHGKVYKTDTAFSLLKPLLALLAMAADSPSKKGIINPLLAIYRDEHIMLLKFPIVLSSNSFFLYLLFSKLFPEMNPGIGNLTCIFCYKLGTSTKWAYK